MPLSRYLTGNLSFFLKVTAWTRSGPGKRMMDVKSVLRAVPAKHLHLFPLRETINVGFLRGGTRLKYCIKIYRLVTVLPGFHFYVSTSTRKRSLQENLANAHTPDTHMDMLRSCPLLANLQTLSCGPAFLVDSASQREAALSEMGKKVKFWFSDL